MKPLTVVPRSAATRDVESIVAYLDSKVSPVTAHRFIAALRKAFGHIASFPSTGSTRFAHELGIPDLRCWPTPRFPYLVFYVERIDHVDVWRILHVRTDVPAWLQTPVAR